MLDIKLLRETPAIVKKNLEKRRDKEKISWIQKIKSLDSENLKTKKQVEALRHKRNIVSEEINSLQKQGKDIKMLPGIIIEMPGNAVHSLKAEKNTAFLLILS